MCISKLDHEDRSDVWRILPMCKSRSQSLHIDDSLVALNIRPLEEQRLRQTLRVWNWYITAEPPLRTVPSFAVCDAQYA